MLPFLHICLNKNKKLKASGRHKGLPSAPRLGAFTLVELLMAVSIFSVVSIAIYSTFSSGASVLRRVKDVDLVHQKILLKTERLSRELREIPACRKQLFLGNKTKITFAGISDYSPCRIAYYFDNTTSSLMRVVDRLDRIITLDGKIDLELKAEPVVFLSKIKEVKFEYLKLDLLKNTYKWMPQWAQDYLPSAVKITIISQSQEYVSTIFLPKE